MRFAWRVLNCSCCFHKLFHLNHLLRKNMFNGNQGDPPNCFSVMLLLFSYIEWWWEYGEIRSGERFLVDLGFRIFIFASMTFCRPAPGSPSQASKLEFLTCPSTTFRNYPESLEPSKTISQSDRDSDSLQQTEADGKQLRQTETRQSNRDKLRKTETD